MERRRARGTIVFLRGDVKPPGAQERLRGTGQRQHIVGQRPGGAGSGIVAPRPMTCMLCVTNIGVYAMMVANDLRRRREETL